MEIFLEACHEVASLNPESLPLDEKDEYWGISLRDFFSTLYVEVGTDSHIVKELLRTREQIIFLVGPRGSGKTTTGLKTVLELENMKYLTQWIPVSIHEANRYLDDRRELQNFFRERIKKFLLNKILTSQGKTTVSPMGQLTAFFLCTDLAEIQRPSTFNEDFVLFRERLEELLSRHKIDYQQTLDDLARPENAFNGALRELQRETLQKAELRHLCYAAKFFLDIRDVVVWIDNIDVFSQQDQVRLVDALFPIARSAPERLRFVVAAREENVLQFDHFYDVQGAVRKTTVYMTDDRNGESLPGMNMPHLDSDKFAEIVKLRLNFAREFQKHIENRVRDLLASESEADKKQSKSLEEKFLPVITDIRRRYVEVLSEKVIKAFKGEKILHLFNNNIRSLLPLHSDFMSHLIGIGYDRNNVPIAFDYDDSFVKTQLLYWLCTVRGEAANEFRHFNIVRHSRNLLLQSSGKHPAIACFLPFLTLSCVWSLCLRNRINSGDIFQIPTIREVIECLSKLECFNENEVKTAIINLYNPSEGGYTMFLAIESRDRLTDINQLKNEHRIRITYKGRAAIASLCNSFAFLYAMQSIADNKAQVQRSLDETKLNYYFNQLLPELKKIGRLHLNSLIQIRRRPAYLGKANWLDLYLDDFGVPLESEYSRTMRASKGYGTSPRKVLYFDSLIHSLEPYTRESREKTVKQMRSGQLERTIKNLIDDYSKILNKIEKGEITEIDDFDFGKS